MSEAAAEALARATGILSSAGIESPAREARLLLAHVQGRPHGLPDLASSVPSKFWAVIARRSAREPVALIIGRQGFWTLDLKVSSDTLIPRADTETLIAASLSAWPERDRVHRVLDLGTGTGALLLAALSEFPAAFGLGVELSLGAAGLARRNTESNSLSGRSAVIVGNWADAIDGRFDLVLANPPYIASQEIPELMPEVRAYEPARALDGGLDGLDSYRSLFPELPRLLAPGGVGLFEFGRGQDGGIAALARRAGLGEPEWHRDLAGVVRAVGFRSPPG